MKFIYRSLLLASAIFPAMYCDDAQGDTFSSQAEQATRAQEIPVDGVIEGDLFIIPNGIVDACEINKAYEGVGDEQEPGLEIWATTPKELQNSEKGNGSENWSAHGHPALSRFPRHLPLRLFMDDKGSLKKEGSKIILYHNHPETHKRTKIILNLNQHGYRYSWCGTFDECVRMQRCNYETLERFYLQSRAIIASQIVR